MSGSARGSDETAAEIERLNRQVYALNAEGRWGEAVRVATDACVSADQLLPADHPVRISARHNLAEVLICSDRPWEAAAEYDRLGPVNLEQLAPLLHVNILNGRGRAALAADPYGPQAGEFLDEALATARRRFGPDHVHLALVLNNRADAHRLAGRVDLARGALDEALEVTGRALPRDVLLLDAQTLLNRSNLAAFAGRLDVAAEHLETVLALRTACHGRDHPDVAVVFNNLGVIAERRGDWAAAVGYHERALDIRRRIQDAPVAVAQSLSGLAEAAFETGDYVTALMRYEELIAWLTPAVGPGHPEVARYQAALARVLNRCGEFDRAGRLFRDALGAMAEARRTGHMDVAPVLSGLGVIALARGEYREVEPLFNEALAVYSAGGSHWLERATVLGTLGIYYTEVRNMGAAEAALRAALAIREEHLPADHPDVGRGYSNLSVFLQQTGRADGAVGLLQTALDRAAGAGGPPHPVRAVFLNNLGAGLRSLDRRQAEQAYRQALRIFEQTYGPDHPQCVIPLANLGSLLADRRAFNRAGRYLRRAVRLDRAAHPLRPSPAGLFARFELALMLARSGRPAAALRLMRRGAAADDRLIGLVSSVSHDAQRLRYVEDARARLFALVGLVADRFADRPAAVRAAFEFTARRKAVGVEVMAARRDALAAGRHPGLLPVINDWRALTVQIADRLLGTPDEAAALVPPEWLHRRAELEATLAREMPELGLTGRSRRVTAAAVAAALPGQSCLVEYVRAGGVNYDPSADLRRPPRYFAFILFEGDPAGLTIRDLGPAAAVDEQVARLHASLPGGGRQLGGGETPPGSASGYEAAGARLRELIFDPIAGALGDRRRLVVSTDGDLNLVPLEALPTPRGYLIDEFTISYAGSARDVLRWAAPVPAAGPAIVVAGPDYDFPGVAPSGAGLPQMGAAHRGPFTPLQAAGREGKQVAAALKGRLLAGPAATREAIRKVPSPAVLHLATHGGFQPFRASVKGPGGATSRVAGLAGSDNPLLRSFVALAGANCWDRGEPTGPDVGSGLLTALDATALDLTGTRLVVLSACESGWGEVADGEGVFGLRRSFELAGARALVISLWKIPDESTERLMAGLYARLGAGGSVAEALRAAQLELKKDRPDPWHWGGFICQGDPGPPQETTGSGLFDPPGG